MSVKKVFVLVLVLKDIFVRTAFSFHTLKIKLCLLTCIVSSEKYGVILVFVSRYITCLFYWDFNIFRYFHTTIFTI